MNDNEIKSTFQAIISSFVADRDQEKAIIDSIINSNKEISPDILDKLKTRIQRFSNAEKNIETTGRLFDLYFHPSLITEKEFNEKHPKNATDNS